MELAERVEALEQTVEAQNEIIADLAADSGGLGTWSRRGIIGSVLAVLGLASASNPAAAQVGQIGDSSNRVDAFLALSNASSYEIEGSPIATSVVASGQVSLSSGSATVSTGVTATDATFFPAIGVDDPGSDVTGLAAQLDFDTSAGEYILTIKETGSSQNPTVNYDIVRAR